MYPQLPGLFFVIPGLMRGLNFARCPRLIAGTILLYGTITRVDCLYGIDEQDHVVKTRSNMLRVSGHLVT